MTSVSLEDRGAATGYDMRDAAVWIARVALTLAVFVGDSAAAADPPKRPLVLAHYMPWFVAKPHSEVWGWHWTMNAFDPEKVEGGKCRIASHYYPLIGPYDSGDPAAIEYHFLLMKLAGIDGVVVDWYGRADLYDYAILHRNTAALLPAAAKVGLRVGICYEDQTIPKLVQAGKLAPADRMKHARGELAWLKANWFTDPAYLTLDGRPVLLSFGFDGLTDGEWADVLPRGNDAPVYFSEHRRRSTASGAFDWPVPKDGLAAQDRFFRAAGEWPASIPVAFPRFRDIYAEAKVRESYGIIPDDAGRTFTATLARALKSGAPLVQIATWNDWGEGTNIEPSAEFGYRDLEAVQRLRRELADPTFAPKADDLRLAHRVYILRQWAAVRPTVGVKLDEAARLIANGQLADARKMLTDLEAEPR